MSNKMMKNLALVLAAVMMLMSLAACGESKPAAPAAPAAPAETPAAPAAPAETPSAPAADAVTFDGEKLEGPFVVTSCGQSPGAVMFGMVAGSSNIENTVDNSISTDTFSRGNAATLVVTTGTSGKGMGAAGTDVDKEIARTTALCKAAKEAGMVVCCAHIEGMSRRTDASDQASIDAIIALADVVLVVEDSDSDGWFTDYTTKNNLPLLKVKDALGIGAILK